MQTTAKLTDINIDFQTKRPKITLLLDSNEVGNLQELNGLKVDLEVNKWHKKRSLDCNAYMWVLIQKIAERISNPEMTVTKEEIYRQAIREVGAYTIVPIKDDAVEEWTRIWQSNGIGWLCDTQPSKLEGFTNVMCYHGSSTYNQAEMNRLVNIVIENCRNLDILTKPQSEIDSLLRSWGK